MKGVPLEVMLRFNRLKALTSDGAVVAAALRKSASGLMQVSRVFSCLSLDYHAYNCCALCSTVDTYHREIIG